MEGKMFEKEREELERHHKELDCCEIAQLATYLDCQAQVEKARKELTNILARLPLTTSEVKMIVDEVLGKNYE